MSFFLPLLFFCLTESGTKVCVKQRDPFYVSRFAPALSADSVRQTPKMKGSITIQGKRKALISFEGKTKVVCEGGRVGGYKIITINETDVVVRTSGGENETWLM